MHLSFAAKMNTGCLGDGPPALDFAASHELDSLGSVAGILPFYWPLL